MNPARFLALAGLVALLAATPAEARRANARVEALYAELDQANAAWRAGLEQMRAGEADAGREAMRQASGRIQDGANRCQSTRGCEVGRFLAAYDALLQHGATQVAGGD